MGVIVLKLVYDNINAIMYNNVNTNIKLCLC